MRRMYVVYPIDKSGLWNKFSVLSEDLLSDLVVF